MIDNCTPEGVAPLAIDIVCADINPLAVYEDAVVCPEDVNANRLAVCKFKEARLALREDVNTSKLAV
tara:strand:+ start:844 stop:1044 length:201 start_codon:yes stop_codon:yes gene_type:complete